MDDQERAEAERQLRLLELLDAALARRDEVFAIVDASANAQQAQERIRELFGVRDPHLSQAVLDLQVSRWTQAGRSSIGQEAAQLRRLLDA